MATNNIEPSSKSKSAVIFMDKYTKAGLSEIKAMCKENDFNDSYVYVIYNYHLHKTEPYKDIIQLITDQDSPSAVIIGSNTCLYPECIMSTTVLGTLEEMCHR